MSTNSDAIRELSLLIELLSKVKEDLADIRRQSAPTGRCPSIHNRWRCSEPAVGPHVHALRTADGRPLAVWLDDGRLLLTPDLPDEGEAFDAADEGDRMIALALLDNAYSIAQCTIDALADTGEGRRPALLAVELLHALCCMIAELPEGEPGEDPCDPSS